MPEFGIKFFPFVGFVCGNVAGVIVFSGNEGKRGDDVGDKGDEDDKGRDFVVNGTAVGGLVDCSL